MFEVEVDCMEFAFVSALPKREKSKLAKVWDTFNELRAAMASKGDLVPATMAAKCLDISRQRVWELMQAGKLDRVEVDGHVFVTADSVVALAKSERKAGRPFKTPTNYREAWKVSVAAGKEMVK